MHLLYPRRARFAVTGMNGRSDFLEQKVITRVRDKKIFIKVVISIISITSMVVNMHLSETWHSKKKRLSPIPNSG